MKKQGLLNNISVSFHSIYLKLFFINDTPQKIALGLGLGVFLGIIPGTGPIAALVIASALRINRASALLGSLITNTWLSIVTFILSIKAGSAIMGLGWEEVYHNWQLLLREKSWTNLLQLSALSIILPVLVGYFLVAFSLGLVVYLFTLIIITRLRNEKNKTRTHLSG